MTQHKKTTSHIRRIFIFTQEMPSGGIEMFEPGERCTTVQELGLIRQGKDIEKEISREKTLRTSQEMKDRQERLLNKIFDAGILTQKEIKTKVVCNTCKSILSGKEKSLTSQLLSHIVSDKHKDKLKVQVKEEERTKVDRNTAERLEAEERAKAAAAEDEEEEEAEVPEEAVPEADATELDILTYLKKKDDVMTMMSDRLLCCLSCRTGLMHLRPFFKHYTSSQHEEKITTSREWRQYVDINDVFEHGTDIFKVCIMYIIYSCQGYLCTGL